MPSSFRSGTEKLPAPDRRAVRALCPTSPGRHFVPGWKICKLRFIFGGLSVRVSNGRADECRQVLPRNDSWFYCYGGADSALQWNDCIQLHFCGVYRLRIHRSDRLM